MRPQRPVCARVPNQRVQAGREPDS